MTSCLSEGENPPVPASDAAEVDAAAVDQGHVRATAPTPTVLGLHDGNMGHATFLRHLDAGLATVGGVHYRPVSMTEAVRGDRPFRIVRRLVAPPNRKVAARLRGEAAASLGARRELRRQIGRRCDGPTDVVHAHTQAQAYFLPALAQGRSGSRMPPTVVSIDLTVPLLAAERRWSRELRTLAALESRTFRRAAHVVAFSDWARRSVVDDYGLSEARVTTIPLPVSVPERPVDDGRPSGGRPVRLLFVGSDFVRKGGPELLSAVRRLPPGDYHLDVCSGDPAAVVPPGLEGVQVHAAVRAGSDELDRLYSEADVFVFPTRYDQSPNVIVEAMSYGLPIVTTDVGAISEMVGRDGACASLVPVGTPVKLAEEIATLAGSDARRRAMGLESRRRAIETSSVEAVAKRWVALFQAVAER